jgi:Polyketide cyclase / dehydrase and lipid transport
MLTLIDRQFIVNVSVDKAWQYLARLDLWPTWAHHIKRIEVDPPGELRPQSSGVIYLSNGLKSTFRMMEFNSYRNWKWAGPFLWLTIRYDHRFESLNSHQTKLRFVLEASGFGVGFFGRLFARIYRRNLEKAIPLLVSQVESYGFGS